jgi:hypothetical protein
MPKPTKRASSAPAPSERVRAEWLRRVEAEYRSAAVTQHLVLWLIQLGVSPDLIDAGLRIVRDELDHAELSHRAFVEAGGQGGPTLVRETLRLVERPGEPLELAVTRACVEVFCLGETVAVRLFKRLRERCDVPVARKVLDRVLRDEVRHRDFGWLLLDYLLESPFSASARELVSRELPGMLSRKRSAYAPGFAKASGELPEADLRWGLMSARDYAAILERAVARDYVPRFEKRGIDAEAAWALGAPEGEASAGGELDLPRVRA